MNGKLVVKLGNFQFHGGCAAGQISNGVHGAAVIVVVGEAGFKPRIMPGIGGML